MMNKIVFALCGILLSCVAQASGPTLWDCKKNTFHIYMALDAVDQRFVLWNDRGEFKSTGILDGPHLNENDINVVEFWSEITYLADDESDAPATMVLFLVKTPTELGIALTRTVTDKNKKTARLVGSSLELDCH